MVGNNQPAPILYEAVNALVDAVGLSRKQACRKLGMNYNTYNRYRGRTLAKEKAGASEQATGTTHAEAPSASPSQDTAGSLGTTTQER